MNSQREGACRRRDWPAAHPGFAPLALTLTLTLALLAPAPARAGCPGDAPTPRLAAIPVDARIGYLRERLEAARVPAERWTAIWGSVDGALIVGQLAALPAAGSRAERTVLAAGALSGSLAIGQMIFLPVAVSAPPPSDGGPCATLAELEASLARGARNQALGTGLAAHAGNVVVNAVVGTLAGVAARNAWSGAVAAGIGWAIGEAQILTQPTDLVRDLARYRAGELPGSGPAPSPSPSPAARLRLTRSGGAIISLAVSF